MLGMNKILLLGRLGNDPEILQTKEGRSYCVLSLATQRRIYNSTDKTGSVMTDWHRVLVWGKQGELCQQYLMKGSPVLMEGHLTTYTVPPTDANAKPIRKTTIHADTVTFLPHQPSVAFAQSKLIQAHESMVRSGDNRPEPEPFLSTDAHEVLDSLNDSSIQ